MFTNLKAIPYSLSTERYCIIKAVTVCKWVSLAIVLCREAITKRNRSVQSKRHLIAGHSWGRNDIDDQIV